MSPSEPLDNPSVLGTFRRARLQLPDFGKSLGVTVCLASIGASGRLILPALLAKVIDDGFDRQTLEIARVTKLCVIAAIATLVSQLAIRLAAYRLGVWSEKQMVTLRQGCVDRYLNMSLDQHARHRRGVLVARATTDVESIARFFEWGAISWLINSVLVIVLSAFLLIADLRLGLVALAFVVPVVMIMRFVQVHLLAAHSRVREHVGTYLGKASELVSGAAVIRSYRAESALKASVEESIQSRKRTAIRASGWGAALFPTGDLLSSVSVVTIVLVGISIGPQDSLSKGVVVAVMFAAIRLLDPVAEISENIDLTQRAVAGLARVLDVLELPVELTVESASEEELPPGPLDVSMVEVWYRYPLRPEESDQVDQLDQVEQVEHVEHVEHVWALRDISLAVPAGTSLAVVGETGSGKSTLARLLVRMSDPQCGSVRVRGVDVRSLNDQSFRARVQLVPQEPFLFDASIADNVRTGRPGLADSAITEAAARLGVQPWLSSLPAGLATNVGERGAELSAGERQLVALLRAEVMNPDVLVLDEATSSVDAALEAQLGAAIERIGVGRTLIVIAHRLSTAARLDRIAVMHDGECVELGTHDELVRLGGRYSNSVERWRAAIES